VLNQWHVLGADRSAASARDACDLAEMWPAKTRVEWSQSVAVTYDAKTWLKLQ